VQNDEFQTFDKEIIRDKALVFFRRLKNVYAKQEFESTDKENEFEMA
jgi:hypothetical protein